MRQPKRPGWWTRKRRWQKIALVVVAVPVALFLALVVATIVDPPDLTARHATATAAKSTTVANAIVTVTAKQQSHDAMTTATMVSASATQGAKSTGTTGAQIAAQAATERARCQRDGNGNLTETPTPVTATGTAITVASTNATATPLAPTNTPIPPTEMPTSAPAETAVSKETATAAVTSTATRSFPRHQHQPSPRKSQCRRIRRPHQGTRHPYPRHPQSRRTRIWLDSQEAVEATEPGRKDSGGKAVIAVSSMNVGCTTFVNRDVTPYIAAFDSLASEGGAFDTQPLYTYSGALALRRARGSVRSAREYCCNGARRWGVINASGCSRSRSDCNGCARNYDPGHEHAGIGYLCASNRSTG
jgi:hypothetical protein